MKCPSCAVTDLVMSERQGIEIDYCPQCRGIWLDRGELDKLIERSNQTQSAAVAPPPQPVIVQPIAVDQRAHHSPTAAPGPAPGPNFYWDGRQWKRKKSWFEEIFD